MTHPCPVCGKTVKVRTPVSLWAELLKPSAWLARHFRPHTRTVCTGSFCGVRAPVEIPNYPSRGKLG